MYFINLNTATHKQDFTEGILHGIGLENRERGGELDSWPPYHTGHQCSLKEKLHCIAWHTAR